MYTSRAVSVFAVTGLALLAQGCMSRLVGEGAEKALGPKGDYWEEKPVASQKDHLALESYKRFELGEVTNDFGRNVPSEFIGLLRTEFTKQIEGSRLPKESSGKTAVFRVRVIHYEKADMTDNVLGPLEQVVARVDMVDKDSGQVLGTANAIGRTGKSLGMGAGSKAEGLAKALVKWASDYCPKPKDNDEAREKKK